MSLASSSRCCKRRSPMFHSMRSRLEASRPRHVLFWKLARAVATARSTSAASKSGTVPRSSPVAGLQTSIVVEGIAYRIRKVGQTIGWWGRRFRLPTLHRARGWQAEACPTNGVNSTGTRVTFRPCQTVVQSRGLTGPQKAMVCPTLMRAADGDADEREGEADHDHDGSPGDDVETARIGPFAHDVHLVDQQHHEDEDEGQQDAVEHLRD